MKNQNPQLSRQPNITRVLNLPKIPLIDDLTTEPVPTGSLLIVQYDPASQWYNASLTMAAGWLRQGGIVSYQALAQPPNDVRSKLIRLGLNVEALEREDKLIIRDWYTVTLGQKSKEKYAVDSVKVADLSLRFRDLMRAPPEPDWLRISDDRSALARFNDEKALVEFMLTRAFPSQKARQSTLLSGFIKGLHTEWLYKQLEAAADGIIDFKLEESGEETRDLIRIRSMRNVGFDRKWHVLRTGENCEVTLDK